MCEYVIMSREIDKNLLKLSHFMFLITVYNTIFKITCDHSQELSENEKIVYQSISKVPNMFP